MEQKQDRKTTIIIAVVLKLTLVNAVLSLTHIIGLNAIPCTYCIPNHANIVHRTSDCKPCVP